MKLPLEIFELSEKCKIRTEIDAQKRGIAAENARIEQWSFGSGRIKSIEKALMAITALEQELRALELERKVTRTAFSSGRGRVTSNMTSESVPAVLESLDVSVASAASVDISAATALHVMMDLGQIIVFNNHHSERPTP